MIRIELNGEGSIDIFFDDDGADELIRYLQHSKELKDHMHLMAGNELEVGATGDKRIIKLATLTYVTSELFKKLFASE